MNARELLNRWLAGRGNIIERTMPIILQRDARLTLDLDFLIHHEMLRRGSDFRFVQIGANDGVSRKDDLIRYIRSGDISGVMVEPQPDLFGQLEKNLADFPRIELVNKAIHSGSESMTLYRLDPEQIATIEGLPHWAYSNGIASFDRDHVAEHVRRIGLGEEVIEEQTVGCVTLSALLEQGGETPDLLKVDTEGYDYEVLAMLDLERHKPAIIHFEHLHIADDRYEQLIVRLQGAGYRFLADKMNTTAYLSRD